MIEYNSSVVVASLVFYFSKKINENSLFKCLSSSWIFIIVIGQRDSFSKRPTHSHILPPDLNGPLLLLLLQSTFFHISSSSSLLLFFVGSNSIFQHFNTATTRKKIDEAAAGVCVSSSASRFLFLFAFRLNENLFIRPT